MTTVTQEYLMGIKQGREYLNLYKPDLSEMKMCLKNIEQTMITFSKGSVKEMFKGERDFWKLQIKKG